MILQTFKVFNMQISEYYSRVFETVKSHVSTIEVLEMSPQDVESLQLNIYNQYFPTPKLELVEIDKDKEKLSLRREEASDLIGNGFTFSLSESESEIHEIWYDLEVDGDDKYLDLTVNFPPREFRGNKRGRKIRLQYHFQESNIDVIGPKALAGKTQFVNLIDQNMEHLLQYHSEKREVVMLKISNIIEEKVANNKQIADDRTKF